MRIFATRGCAAGASGAANASQASKLPIERALCFPWYLRSGLRRGNVRDASNLAA